MAYRISGPTRVTHWEGLLGNLPDELLAVVYMFLVGVIKALKE